MHIVIHQTILYLIKIYFFIYGKSATISKKKKTLKEVLRIKLLNIKTDYVFKRVFGHIKTD